jgi:[protein-PII] uridylyltransferase
VRWVPTPSEPSPDATDPVSVTKPVVARLRDDLEALDRATPRGELGLETAHRRALLVEAAISELFGSTETPPSMAVVAVGGLGRMRQLPRSDVDLLMLHEGLDPGAVSIVADRLFYPLWDAGFELGQAVRTPGECVAVAGERLDALTAMLDIRHLAGDRALSERVAASIDAIARADPVGFAERLRNEAAEREARFGSAAHRLEPDLKSGAGGLRDVQSIRWIRRFLGDDPVRTADIESLDEAEEFLIRVRSILHLETGKRADRLPVELQPAVASAMGYADRPRWTATDGLMRTVFEHARTVRWIAEGVFERAGGTAGPAEPASAPLRGPGRVLDALARAAEWGGRPSFELIDRIVAGSIEDPVRWDPGAREGFLRILRARSAGLHALETLDRLGLLVRFVPAWSDVRCRPQRDPYHRLTVDAHLTAALDAVGRALRSPDPDDPVAREAASLVSSPDGLLLGALLHDIGKVGEGSHVAIGGRVAEETLRRMGIDGADADLAIFLVAQHLLLPDTATRRDLTDENLILDVAATIGSPDRLAALYLLARADAEATGPSAWTPWRQALIRELAGRIQRVFERGDMGAELAERLAARTDHLRALLSTRPHGEVERFVLRMPRGYFLAVEPAAAARHFPIVSPDLTPSEVRTDTVPGARPGTSELLVVAPDRPGLLSWIAGSLALAGLSILTAQAFTTADGVAVDLFEVEGAFEREIDEARWPAFRATLLDAVAARISLAHLIAEQRRRYPDPAIDTPVTIGLDNDASEFSTVVEVGAPDRLGLLYDITSALADLRLDVHLAKVATYTGRVIDVFYVRDPAGAKLTDRSQIGEVEAALAGRLEARLA